YSGTSLMSLLLQHRDAPLPSLREARPDAPESVNALFQRMVAKKPGDRYATMTEVAHALEDATQSLSAAGLSAPGPRPAPRPGISSSESTLTFPSAGQSTDHGEETKATPATLVSDTPLASDRPPIAPAAETRSQALPPPPQPPSPAPRRNRGVIL